MWPRPPPLQTPVPSPCAIYLSTPRGFERWLDVGSQWDWLYLALAMYHVYVV